MTEIRFPSLAPRALTPQPPISIRHRPHPHLTSPTIYLNSFPADLSDNVISECLVGCSPLRIILDRPVPTQTRLMPDVYYDWMPRSGYLQFPSLADAEKALAILGNHTLLTPRGVWVSPFPPSQPVPFHSSPTSERMIRPARLTDSSSLSHSGDIIRDFSPSPAELYDAVRPWGALKSANTWVAESSVSHDPSKLEWFAKVEFWYADEAQRFETEFGRANCLVKGWQVQIWGNSLTQMTYPVQKTFPLSPGGSFFPADIPFGTTFVPAPVPGPADPRVTPIQLPQPMSTQVYLPPTPPISDSPPWASHNPFAYKPVYAVAPHHHAPMIGSPNGAPEIRSRRSLGNLVVPSRISQRRWSLTVGETPDGMLQPTGLVADDGTIIQHGPGQHIRPAPAFGPGSSSVSGLVDYSNIFVKNLDPDVNSFYLEETFSQFGRVVSARVMRDDVQRSRGYGFVSFFTPEEASAAIQSMNGVQFGKQILSVALHEPRKLRPEKIAERVTTPGSYHPALPHHLGRRSSSPSRHTRHAKEVKNQDNMRFAEDSDDIRLLSPHSRKAALTKRLTSRVKNYVKGKDVSENMIGPVVEALLPFDLTLVPLLHSRWELDNRIAETLSSIQECSEMTLRPTDEDLANLCSQLEKIDPIDCKEVGRILLQTLESDDWEKLMTTKSEVAIKYGIAKRVLLKQRSEDAKKVSLPTDSQTDDQKDGDDDVSFSPVPLETITIPILASLPCKDIIQNIAGDSGRLVREKLGIESPSESERQNMLGWSTRMSSKGKVGMKAEVVALLAKHVQDNDLRKSEKIKMLSAFVNAEDDDLNVCELVLYPALLNCKVQDFIESRWEK